MFDRKELTILDWWVFWILMVIPFLNIIIGLILLVSSGTNKTLKNYILASILPVIILVFLWFAFIATLFADIAI